MAENFPVLNVNGILELDEESQNIRLSVSSTSSTSSTSTRSSSIKSAEKIVIQKAITLNRTIKGVIDAVCEREVTLRLLTYVDDIEISFQSHVDQLYLKITEPLQPIPHINLELAKVIGDIDPIKFAGEKASELLIGTAHSTLSEFSLTIKGKINNINDMAVLKGVGNWFDHEKLSFTKLLLSMCADRNTLQC